MVFKLLILGLCFNVTFCWADENLETYKSLLDQGLSIEDLKKYDEEIKQLQLELVTRKETYKKTYTTKPKKRFFGATIKDNRFVNYLENWRRKVELIGNKNYPINPAIYRMYGSPQVTVEIKSDGSIESIEINKTAGYKLLDEHVIYTIYKAAPFEEFPQDIKVDTDIISYTRTWQFMKAVGDTEFTE